MYKGNEGKCYGHWDIKDSACARCLIFARMRCEKLTRRKRSEESAGRDENAMSEADKRNDLNEYFFGLLDVRIDRPTVHWGEPIVTHYYYGSDRNLVLFVGCDMSSGKLKVVVPQKVKRVLVLESTEQADALVKELLG
jgi:hypothetical protein